MKNKHIKGNGNIQVSGNGNSIDSSSDKIFNRVQINSLMFEVVDNEVYIMGDVKEIKINGINFIKDENENL